MKPFSRKELLRVSEVEVEALIREALSSTPPLKLSRKQALMILKSEKESIVNTVLLAGR